MDDHVLSMARRGHTAVDTLKAMDLLKKRSYQIGLQIMIGLPGDSPEKALVTAKKSQRCNPILLEFTRPWCLNTAFWPKCTGKENIGRRRWHPVSAFQKNSFCILRRKI
jgi:hypothetical protein